MKQAIACIDFDGVVIEKLYGREWVGCKKIRKVNWWWLVWTMINHTWRKPVEGVKEGLTTLINKGYKIVLLTSRRKEFEEITRRWLKRNNLFELFDEFYFNNEDLGALDYKIKYFGLIRGDLHIDDNRETIKALGKTYGDKKFYLIGDKNHQMKNIKEVTGWAKIHN